MDMKATILKENSIKVFSGGNDNPAPEARNADGSQRYELQQQRYSADDEIRNQQAMMQQIQL